LWYSYGGGRVDQSTGGWIARGYGCVQTGDDYREDLAALEGLEVPFARANPNTDMYLVGHSQGGLIALQELGYLSRLPATVRVAGIITLDSPLGGVPELDAFLASQSPTVCWRGPAVAQLGAEYLTSVDHLAQGSTASLLCTFFACPDASAWTSNFDAVHAYGEQTRVTTLGNSDDATYFAPKCNIDVGRLSADNRSTMVVAGAGGGLAPLDHDLPLPPPVHVLLAGNPPWAWPRALLAYDPCVTNSHRWIAEVDAPLIAGIIGPEPGAGQTGAAGSPAPTAPTPVGAALSAGALSIALYVPPGAGGAATLSVQAAGGAAPAVAAGPARLITIASAHIRLRPGRTQTIPVKLNAAGRRLASHGRLDTITATIKTRHTHLTDTLMITKTARRGGRARP
jgi:hypothetical protein